MDTETERTSSSGKDLVDPNVEIDNNPLENAIRPFALEERDWLFSDTVPGARASANLYSLIETAKANHVEPHAYLSLLFAQLPHAKTVEDFEKLLPWNVKAALPATHLYSSRAEHRHTVS